MKESEYTSLLIEMADDLNWTVSSLKEITAPLCRLHTALSCIPDRLIPPAGLRLHFPVTVGYHLLAVLYLGASPFSDVPLSGHPLGRYAPLLPQSGN